MELPGAFQKHVFLSPELNIPYYLAKSCFLLVTPAALTTSMFVSVCTTLDGVRGLSSVSHDTCSPGFACKTGFVAELTDGLTSLQNLLLPRPDS
ncbi:hypothetical protein BDR06DRAFT_961383 [Suillus hirtellus]|nr:hypothetical protein BDR06DRAFT_961383 [Suillus hirtellus]